MAKLNEQHVLKDKVYKTIRPALNIELTDLAKQAAEIAKGKLEQEKALNSERANDNNVENAKK